MSRTVAIIGASGAVGSTLAAHLLRSQMLEPGDRLQLVGHGLETSSARLLATRIDLLDAFDDNRVDVEMVPEIADVDADIVVVATGTSMSSTCRDRRDMGAQNIEIFEYIAEVCAARLPDAFYVVISNPVELAVRILCKKLDRKRVIGMGAQQDSMRFGRAIAKDIGISRHQVHAAVLGEHGQAMVPLWSSIEIAKASKENQQAFDALSQLAAEIPLPQRVRSLQSEVTDLLAASHIPEAYDAARRALPDARIFVEPFITAFCVHSTPNATANATLVLLQALMACDYRKVYGQVLLDGEFLGIRGICGVPLALDSDQWIPHVSISLTDDEKSSVFDSVRSIEMFMSETLEASSAC